MSADQVNAILDSFDEAWATGQLPRIDNYLDSLRTHEDLQACVGACAADLEWRWRTFFAANELTECYRAETYLQNFPDLFSEKSQYESLLHAEWQARSRWGDAPTVDDFVSSPESLRNLSARTIDPSDLRSSLVRSLDEIAPLVTTVFHGDDELRFICPPEYEIGRRRKSDPPAIAWVESLNRLVVTDAAELTVSRKQLVVRRIRLNQVELINMSKNVTISVGHETLEPGKHERIDTPFSIQLLDVRIFVKTN